MNSTSSPQTLVQFGCILEISSPPIAVGWRSRLKTTISAFAPVRHQVPSPRSGLRLLRHSRTIEGDPDFAKSAAQADAIMADCGAVGAAWGDGGDPFLGHTLLIKYPVVHDLVCYEYVSRSCQKRMSNCET
jgi:hypothetical protein